MNRIQSYFASPALNSSKLKLVYNPKKLFLLENGLIDDEESAALRIGSAVDCLLTDPDRWEEEFLSIEVEKPYGMMLKFIQNLPKNISILSDTQQYEQAYKASGYKIPIERVIEKFWSREDYVKYYTSINSTDKTVLSADEFVRVQSAIAAIASSPYAIHYFSRTDTIFQVPIYFELEQVACKALIDGILVDKSKKLLLPFDLKTTSRDILKFEEIFYEYGYNIQAGLYYKAMEFYRDINYPDYEIDTFRFIVTPSTVDSYYPAIVFKLSDATLNSCINEVYTRLEEYKWIRIHNEKNYPRRVIESGGEIEI